MQFIHAYIKERKNKMKTMVKLSRLFINTKVFKNQSIFNPQFQITGGYTNVSHTDRTIETL